MDPNDPMTRHLAEELRLTNEHIANLLRQANRPKEPDHSIQFDKLINDLLRKLDEAWRRLNERVSENVPRSLDDLEQLIYAHKQFEDDLQALDVDVSNVKGSFNLKTQHTVCLRALPPDSESNSNSARKSRSSQQPLVRFVGFEQDVCRAVEGRRNFKKSVHTSLFRLSKAFCTVFMKLKRLSVAMK